MDINYEIRYNQGHQDKTSLMENICVTARTAHILKECGFPQQGTMFSYAPDIEQSNDSISAPTAEEILQEFPEDIKVEIIKYAGSEYFKTEINGEVPERNTKHYSMAESVALAWLNVMQTKETLLRRK